MSGSQMDPSEADSFAKKLIKSAHNDLPSD